MTQSRARALLFALTATMLTSCGHFGGSPPPSGSLSVALAPPPADLQECFAKLVPAPPGGALTRQQVVALVGALRHSELAKSACGQRLLGWYAIEAAGLAK